MRRATLIFSSIVALTLIVDQATKALVRASLTPGDSIPLIDGVFHLTYVRNLGAAFGLFPGFRPVFVLTTLVVLVAIGAYWRRYRPEALPIVIALGLITGGAIGNAIDRLFMGGLVTDFFDATILDFPVFNVADSAIVVGVTILIAWLLFAPEPDAPEPNSEDVPAPDAPDGF